ncbi:MAG: transferase [Paenibacillus sp.]|nr:transferase [Paenibacillus sp.]
MESLKKFEQWMHSHNHNKMVLIIGAGSLGLLTLDILIANKETASIAFLDDQEVSIGQHIHGYPVFGPIAAIIVHLSRLHHTSFIIAIAGNTIRKKLADAYRPLTFINAIHPQTVISPFATLGIGNIVLPGTVIDPDVQIGNHTIINKSVSIGHNSVLMDCSQAAHGVRIGGFSCLKPRAFIGLGASLLPHITVGEDAIVGAGAVVTRHVDNNQTVVGVPAKPIANAKPSTGGLPYEQADH